MLFSSVQHYSQMGVVILTPITSSHLAAMLNGRDAFPSCTALQSNGCIHTYTEQFEI